MSVRLTRGIYAVIGLIALTIPALVSAPASAAPHRVDTVNDAAATDVNGDGSTDFTLTGVSGWNTLPTAFSNNNGSFTVTNSYVGDFGAWAATPGVKVLAGDFNGDGHTDVALTGVAGWNTLPVALSNGDGSYVVSNLGIGDFATWASTPGVKIVTGDFDGDGRTDVALTGVPGWNTLPTALSNGNGSFTVTNTYIGDFATWSASNGVKVITGDFNGDRRTDVALTGVSGWASLPVAFSNGNGSYSVTNNAIADFATWAATPGVHALTGDFNGDNRTDVALTGVSGWASLPVAFSNGNGSFGVTNSGVGSFATWAATPGVKVLTGDFNGDRKTDVVLTGVSGWASLPTAFSAGNGSFGITNTGVASFATWAATPGVKVVAGDVNGDNRTDLALTGVPGWASVPVAFSAGTGAYSVTNNAITDFGTWASTPGALVVSTPNNSPR